VDSFLVYLYFWFVCPSMPLSDWPPSQEMFGLLERAAENTPDNSTAISCCTGAGLLVAESDFNVSFIFILIFLLSI
jgi:hypothetical protein